MKKEIIPKPFKLLKFSHMDDKAKIERLRILDEFVESAKDSEWLILMSDGQMSVYGLNSLELIGILERNKAVLVNADDEEGDYEDE